MIPKGDMFYCLPPPFQAIREEPKHPTGLNATLTATQKVASDSRRR